MVYRAFFLTLSTLIMPELLEDITTAEQLRRCRELLASNLCAQGVRALSNESLPQLIAKVSKIDRQQRHIDTLRNYISTLKTFAIDNACDYAVFSTNGTLTCNSNTTPDGANLTSAYTYWSVPTSFTLNGAVRTVAASDVVLVSFYYANTPWGASASSNINHYHAIYRSFSTLNDIRKFSALKSMCDGSSSSMWTMWGTTSISKVEMRSGSFVRSSNAEYRLYTYPYSTSYDYWYGSGVCYLYYPIWAVKLSALGTSPNNLFPTEPVIPKQEFYY
jgi:hypothetical protein